MKKRSAALAVLVVLAAPACRRQAQVGGPPPMPVEVVTLAERAVPQTTEYVGTVKSRRSSNVQPQVDGFITAIKVRSGDSVKPGAALMEIDPSLQDAACREPRVAARVRQADLQRARQQARA
jgi:multidrug efflux pump subunit AcrA (membrane-fusion protein)